MENKYTRQKTNSNFIIQGSILAVTSILVRLIGILYRVPLINIIGDEGMGYYSNAFSVYSILLLLSSYSLPLAVSKMVSERIGRGQHKNALRILKASLLFATVIGGIGAIITWFGAEFFANTFFPMPFCIFALKSLAPTIWIMAYLGVLRGYFQGLGTMVPTALSQIFEQIINAIVSVGAAAILFKVGLKSDLVYESTEYSSAFGAAGGTIGTGAGALTALLFCVFVFFMLRKVIRKQMRRDRSHKHESYRRITKVLLVTIVPVILSTAIYNVSTVIDSSIFGHSMTALGKNSEYATLWGVYDGKYHLLVNVPIAIASALASSLIPALTASVASGNRGQVVERVNTAIRFAMVVAIPSAVGLMVLAGPINNLLFSGNNELSIKLTVIGASAVIFFSLSTVTNAILQGINHMNIPIRNSLISLSFHVIALLVMVLGFKMGIYSVVIANILFGIFMCVLNSLSIGRYLDYRQEIKKTFLLPLIASFIMGAVAFGMYTLIFKLVKSNGLGTFAAILAAVLVYVVLLIKLKCVDEVELYNMPKGAKLVRLAHKLHLL